MRVALDASCISPPLLCPPAPTTSRRLGERVLVRSVPPPICLITPLLRLAGSISNSGGRWHPAQPAPPGGGLMKSALPLFSAAVKLGKFALLLPTCERPR